MSGDALQPHCSHHYRGLRCRTAAVHTSNEMVPSASEAKKKEEGDRNSCVTGGGSGFAPNGHSGAAYKEISSPLVGARRDKWAKSVRVKCQHPPNGSPPPTNWFQQTRRRHKASTSPTLGSVKMPKCKQQLTRKQFPNNSVHSAVSLDSPAPSRWTGICSVTFFFKSQQQGIQAEN